MHIHGASKISEFVFVRNTSETDYNDYGISKLTSTYYNAKYNAKTEVKQS